MTWTVGGFVTREAGGCSKSPRSNPKVCELPRGVTRMRGRNLQRVTSTVGTSTQGRTGRASTFDAQLGTVQHGGEFPHEVFRAIRSESPVLWSDRLSSWIIAGYSEARAVLSDPGAYAVNFDQPSKPTSDGELKSAEFVYAADPPRHGQLRAVYTRSGALTEESAQTISPVVRQAAVAALASWPAEEGGDAIDDFARPVVCATFADLFGVSVDAMSWIGSLWLHNRPGGSVAFPRPQALPAHQEMFSFFQELVIDRLENPGDDFISRFVVANQRRKRMSEGTLVWTLVDVALNAPVPSQSALALGAGALADHPAQFRALRGEPALARQGAEEIFRWAPPTQLVARRVARRSSLGEATLEPGDRVSVFLPSANRDERMWEHPDLFDIRRPAEPPHLSFGHGIHQTPGAPLARMVLATCLHVLAELALSVTRLGETTYWSDPSSGRSRACRSISSSPREENSTGRPGDPGRQPLHLARSGHAGFGSSA